MSFAILWSLNLARIGQAVNHDRYALGYLEGVKLKDAPAVLMEPLVLEDVLRAVGVRNVGRTVHNVTDSAAGPKSAPIGYDVILSDFLPPGAKAHKGYIPTQIGQLKRLWSLIIVGVELSGSIPTEIGHVSTLRVIDFWNSGISGTLPSEIGRLRALKRFQLKGTKLIGTVPEEVGRPMLVEWFYISISSLRGQIPTQISRFGKLQRLNLARASFEGPIPTELARIQVLQRVEFMHNRLEGSVPFEISPLTLTALDIQVNNLTGSVPTEVAHLTTLDLLDAGWNKLTGTLSTELGKLRNLNAFVVTENLFYGQVPTELGTLGLQRLQLARNSFESRLPSEIGKIRELGLLDLCSNRLSGHLPPQLVNLKVLNVLGIDGTLFDGPLPGGIGKLTNLISLYAGANLFTGALPTTLGQLHKLKRMGFGESRLTGVLPSEFGKLTGVSWLNLRWNSLSASLPKELGKMRSLQTLCLGKNSFTGVIPSEIGDLRALTTLAIGTNYFVGAFPKALFKIRDAQVISLRDNNFHGQLPGGFCDVSDLQELYLDSNHFSGSIPSEIACLTELKTLVLQKNRLEGSLPTMFTMANLNVLTLHRNRLTGTLAESPHGLPSVGLLTLHGNRFRGTVPPLSLRPWAVDSMLYQDSEGWGCDDQSAGDCKDDFVMFSCPLHCSDELGVDQVYKPVLITLHRNVLSCALPPSITRSLENADPAIKSIVLMGNLFDDPRADHNNWVSKDEQDVSFLFNSEKSFLIVLKFACGPVLAAFCNLLAFRYVFGSDWQNVFAIAFYKGSGNSVFFPHNFILRAFVPLVSITLTCILPICLASANGYYTCGLKTARLTMAYLGGSPKLEWSMSVVWPLWSCLSIRIQSVPPQPESSPLPASKKASRRFTISSGLNAPTTSLAGTGGAWLMWPFIVLSLGIPSIIYSMTNTLPENNILFDRIGNSGVLIFYGIHYACPLLTSAVNAFLLPEITRKFSSWTGIPQVRLVMRAWSATSWMIAAVSVLFLHENCAGMWKLLWDKCRTTVFDEDMGPVNILTTHKDICQHSFSGVLVDDRCPRAVVETITPLLLGSLCCWAFFSPIWYLAVRKLQKKLKIEAEVNASLSLPELLLFVEITLVWGPLVPVLVPLAALATISHLLVHTIMTLDSPIEFRKSRCAKFTHEFPRLHIHLGTSMALGLGFQAWFAFSSGMCGRYCLVIAWPFLFALYLFYAPSASSIPRRSNSLVDYKKDRRLSWCSATNEDDSIELARISSQYAKQAFASSEFALYHPDC